MKRYYVVSLIVSVACILPLQIGCQPKNAVAEESKKAISPTSESVSGSAEAEAAAGQVKPTAESAKAETVKEVNEVNEPVPKITFENVVHDFGSIGPGTKNTCEFKFTNTGGGTLEIGRIKATCGCTIAGLSKKKYAPGESGTIKVTYRSGKRDGATRKHLFVPSNDKANPKVRLTIKAKIGLKVDYQPKRLQLKGKNSDCPDIVINGVDGKAFSIKHFKSIPACITADVNSSLEATKFVLKPRLDTEKLSPGLNGRVEIELTHPDLPKVTIPFSVMQEYTVKPPTLIVINAEPNKMIEREVWVLSNYDKEFEIESVSTKSTILRVISQEKVITPDGGAGQYKFVLQIRPPVPNADKPGIFTDEFHVTMKSGEELKVPFSGFYSKETIESLKQSSKPPTEPPKKLPSQPSGKDKPPPR